jgi:hypothetical protein
VIAKYATYEYMCPLRFSTHRMSVTPVSPLSGIDTVGVHKNTTTHVNAVPLPLPLPLPLQHGTPHHHHNIRHTQHTPLECTPTAYDHHPLYPAAPITNHGLLDAQLMRLL